MSEKEIDTQIAKTAFPVRTGEEDENTIASVRGKLFTMAENKSWKERGTGTVRCNVAKKHGGGARLGERSRLRTCKRLTPR